MDIIYIFVHKYLGVSSGGVREVEVKLQTVDPSPLWLSTARLLCLWLRQTGKGRYAANVCKPINASTY